MHPVEGARLRPGPFRVLLVLALAAAVSSCTRSPAPEELEEGLPRRFGEPAAPAPSPTGGTDHATEEPSTTTAGPTPRPAAGDRPAQTPAPRVVGRTDDPAGDLTGGGPGYADVISVAVREVGATAHVEVRVAADVPGRLAEGEVIGIGVDLFTRGGDEESSHQLFADGSSEGWTAYLQAPEGFVEYPGSFTVGGRSLVFEVPWRSLGEPSRGAFSLFSDWSRSRAVLNEAGSDAVPDEGRVPFTR